MESDYDGVPKEPDPLMTKSLVFTDVSGQPIGSHLQKSTLRVKIKLNTSSICDPNQSTEVISRVFITDWVLAVNVSVQQQAQVTMVINFLFLKSTRIYLLVERLLACQVEDFSVEPAGLLVVSQYINFSFTFGVIFLKFATLSETT